MLRFTVHQFKLSNRSYILLPKLNSVQMGLLTTGLTRHGFSFRYSGPRVTAKSERGLVHVDPAGLCWARFDPSDIVLPLIPELVKARKEEIPLGGLAAKYLKGTKSGQDSLVLLTRLESGPAWDSLRSLNECGLSPDEYRVASFLVSRAKRWVRVTTDYPVGDMRSSLMGRKRYFLSNLSPDQAESTLRQAGRSQARNSYLPRDGVLESDGILPPSRQELGDLFSGLGEWCYFVPRAHESSNWRPGWARPAPVV